MLLPVWERLAKRHLTAGTLGKAAHYLERIKRKAPGRPGIRRDLGVVWAGRGRFEEAESLLTEELSRFGPSTQTLRALGDLYYAWGRREKALQFYASVRDQASGENLEVLNYRIRQCESRESFSDVLASQRFFRAGNEAMLRRDFDVARYHFEKATTRDFSNFQAFNNLGALYLNHTGEPDKALSCFTQALRYGGHGYIRQNLERARRAAERQRSGSHLSGHGVAG